MNTNEIVTRDKKIDALRGILIILVVLGHSTHSLFHDFIFLFHMPLFFILSGFLISKNGIAKKGYYVKKVKQIMMPYFVYGIADIFLVRHSIKQSLRLLWGGRAIGGVYWYVTCYLFSMVLLIFLVQHFSEKICKLIILVGGGYISNRVTLNNRFFRSLYLRKNTGIIKVAFFTPISRYPMES